MNRANQENRYPDRKEELVSIETAHRAMVKFVEAFWVRDGESIDGLHRLLSFNNRADWISGPPDPAQWADWIKAIDDAELEKRQQLS